MDKFTFKTADGIDVNLEKLSRAFPEVITETVGEDGKIKRVADFEKLKMLLGDSAAERPQEFYEFTWPGKNEAIFETAKATTKTLRPCPEESKNWDTTQNLYIEGDNLEALKILQEAYLGKVKMIYIDPPYNTGKDFVYRDNFHKSAEEGKEDETVRDEETDNNLFQNTESNGRFHSDWCSMIYPRLKLARDLLRDDGVIFISIDDNEVHNLRKICDEIFGESNFIGTFVWFYEGVNDNQDEIKKTHEYILVYSKNKVNILFENAARDINVELGETVENSVVKNGAANPPSTIILPSGFPCETKKGTIKKSEVKSVKYSGDLVIEDYKLTNAVSVTSGWSSKNILELFIKNKFEEVYDSKNQLTRFEIKNNGNINYKKKRAQSYIISVLRNYGTTLVASKMLEGMGLGGCFSFSKPNNLIKFLIKTSSKSTDIVLDFFSGSATTAHACMQLNAEDGGNRKFIMVQLPEVCAPDSEAAKAGYKNICEIGKERIRRAGEKIKAEHATTAPNLDIGFRVLKIDESIMKDVFYSPNETSQDLLSTLESNIKEDRTNLDLLFACLIDWGVELSLPLKTETIDGVEVHTMSDGDTPALIACFAQNIPETVVRKIAARHPIRAVFRDSSFADSPAKINLTEIFKTYSPTTKVNAL